MNVPSASLASRRVAVIFGAFAFGYFLSALRRAIVATLAPVFAAVQLRLNSWILMTGSLGMVASTLPAQILLPVTGWRGLFVSIALLLALAMAGIALATPSSLTSRAAAADKLSCRAIVLHLAFVRALPMGFSPMAG